MTRTAGQWRVTEINLTHRAKPAGVSRDGDKEATRDGQQWRITFNGTFMGYVYSEQEIKDMLGKAVYDELREV